MYRVQIKNIGNYHLMSIDILCIDILFNLKLKDVKTAKAMTYSLPPIKYYANES